MNSQKKKNLNSGNGTLALINRLLKLLNSDIPNQTNIVSTQRKRKGP